MVFSVTTHTQVAILHHVVFTEDLGLLGSLARSKVSAHVDEAQWLRLLAWHFGQGFNGCDGPVSGDLDRLFPWKVLELHWRYGNGPVQQLATCSKEHACLWPTYQMQASTSCSWFLISSE